MATKKPKPIPVFERHPFSAEYEDITGAEWIKFSDGVRDYYNGRPVMLFQGKVLDGWQLYRACVLHGIMPNFMEFTGNELEAEQFVEIHNDNRRHIGQHALEKHARERRERVAKLRAGGMSYRSIADEEEVSEKTIRNDVDSLTAEGTQVEPPDGKITGKDGRKRPARRSSKPKAPKPPKLCARCKRVGGASCDKCRKKMQEYEEAVEELKPPPKANVLEFEWPRFDRMRELLKELEVEADAQLSDSKEHSSPFRNKIVTEARNLEPTVNQWQHKLKRKKEGQRHA